MIFWMIWKVGRMSDPLLFNNDLLVDRSSNWVLRNGSMGIIVNSVGSEQILLGKEHNSCFWCGYSYILEILFLT